MTIRQFQMLALIKKKPKGLNVTEVLELNQKTFGSLCHNFCVEYNAYTDRFLISETGRRMFKYFDENSFLFRLHNNGRFSQYVKRSWSATR